MKAGKAIVIALLALSFAGYGKEGGGHAGATDNSKTVKDEREEALLQMETFGQMHGIVSDFVRILRNPLQTWRNVGFSAREGRRVCGKVGRADS